MTAQETTRRPPLPPGTRLRPDDGLRLRHDGRVVLGGNPLRFLRLTEAGADALRRWLGGEAPGSSPGTVALARRLVDGGMVHPAPPAPHPDPPLTVIIPVKDDPDGLTATLATLADAAVIVVDDGSATPVGPLVADLAPSAHTIRRSVSGGPGVARQDGLAVAETELVAFVDAGVELDITDLRRLSGWFADPELVAVAPRVVAAAAEGPIAGYEQTASPLDLGPDPSPVGPGRSVSYLPTACLVARRGTVVAAGRQGQGDHGCTPTRHADRGQLGSVAFGEGSRRRAVAESLAGQRRQRRPRRVGVQP